MKRSALPYGNIPRTPASPADRTASASRARSSDLRGLCTKMRADCTPRPEPRHGDVRRRLMSIRARLRLPSDRTRLPHRLTRDGWWLVDEAATDPIALLASPSPRVPDLLSLAPSPGDQSLVS